MRIVVTDTCFLWKQYQYILKKFKDMLLVVYLEGKPESDEYDTLVCSLNTGKEDLNLYDSDIKIDLFPSLKEKLQEKLKGDKDVLFLADYNLISLYPLIALVDGYMDKKVHLCTVSPFEFDMKKYVEYKKALGDLSELTSILYIDSNKYLNISRETSLLDALKEIEKQYISVLPTIVNSVENLYGKFFFDLSSGTYVNISKGDGYIGLIGK